MPTLPVLHDCVPAHSMPWYKSNVSRGDHTSSKPGERPAPRESMRRHA